MMSEVFDILDSHLPIYNIGDILSHIPGPKEELNYYLIEGIEEGAHGPVYLFRCLNNNYTGEALVTDIDPFPEIQKVA